MEKITLDARDAKAILSILTPFVSTDKDRPYMTGIHVMRDPVADVTVWEATDGARVMRIRLPGHLATVGASGSAAHYLIRDPKKALAIVKAHKAGSVEIDCVRVMADEFPDISRVIPSAEARAGEHTLAGFDPSYLEDLGAAYRIAAKWAGGYSHVTLQMGDRRDAMLCLPTTYDNGATITHVLMPTSLTDSEIAECESLARAAVSRLSTSKE